LIVDEYQDCTITQHALIRVLGTLLPVRVLGDPLQAIYDFGESATVDWNPDVVTAYPPLELPTEP
jgi:superfamily I DNA/RNA helicase